MPVNYYLDGTNLGNSTSVYLDADLTQVAPDGFYSNGYTYRQLSNGVLLASVTCPSCDGGGGTPTCTQYTISNRSTVDTVGYTYTDCNGNLQEGAVLPDSDTPPFCAETGSISLQGNAIIVDEGACP